MRLGYLVLVATTALLSSCDAGSSSIKNVGQANLLSDDLTAHGIDKRFLRRSSGVIANADNEERDVGSAISRTIRSVQVKLKSKTLKSDPKLKKEFDTFKKWYKKDANTPIQIWRGLRLGPFYRHYYAAPTKAMQANPDYQRFVLYEKFYKIVTNQLPKSEMR